MKSRSKIVLFFQMSAILKFDFQKKKTITFFCSKLSKLGLHKKKNPNFACDNYIFSKTRGDKNKQWTHPSPVKQAYFGIFFVTLPDPSIFDYYEIKANLKHFVAYAA